MSNLAPGRNGCEPDAAMIDLALRAAAAAGADFAGVDMIFDASDALQVLEVNSMPGWRGLQKVAPFSIADRLAAIFLRASGAAEGAQEPAAEPVERRHRANRHHAGSCRSLHRRLPRRDRGAEARQCPCLRRRPRHDRRPFSASAEAAARALCNTVASGRRAHFRRRRSDLRRGRQEHQSWHRAPMRPAGRRRARGGEELGSDLRQSLAAFDHRPDAAEAAFAAILLAKPAGLGHGAAPRCPWPGAEATLLEAMQEAAAATVSPFNMRRLCGHLRHRPGCAGGGAGQAGRRPGRRFRSIWLFWPHFPTAISRANMGRPPRRRCSRGAAGARRFYVKPADPADALADLLIFDRRLKAAGFNPGTSADLTVATLFADRLTRILIQRRNNG